mmetsp:Transcript_115027/g.256955  ORF Transcript_115027/g.256955 Transcript_115027/m.256955 type:complete len:362 (-) Transcript_115027:37-1122(-)
MQSDCIGDGRDSQDTVFKNLETVVISLDHRMGVLLELAQDIHQAIALTSNSELHQSLARIESLLIRERPSDLGLPKRNSATSAVFFDIFDEGDAEIRAAECDEAEEKKDGGTMMQGHPIIAHKDDRNMITDLAEIARKAQEDVATAAKEAQQRRLTPAVADAMTAAMTARRAEARDAVKAVQDRPHTKGLRQRSDPTICWISEDIEISAARKPGSVLNDSAAKVVDIDTNEVVPEDRTVLMPGGGSTLALLTCLLESCAEPSFKAKVEDLRATQSSDNDAHMGSFLKVLAKAWKEPVRSFGFGGTDNKKGVPLALASIKKNMGEPGVSSAAALIETELKLPIGSLFGVPPVVQASVRDAAE